MDDNELHTWDYTDIPPPPPRLERGRTAHNGRYESARNRDQRDAWAAARWTINRWPLQEIATALGFTSRSAAHDSVQRGLHATRQEAAINSGQARTAHRAHLQYALEAAMAVLEADHITVSNGRVVALSGQPIKDHDPILRAIDRVVRISESLRRLDGLDAPAKVDATITEATQQDVELQEMVNEYRAKNSTVEQQLRAQTESGE